MASELRPKGRGGACHANSSGKSLQKEGQRQAGGKGEDEVIWRGRMDGGVRQSLCGKEWESTPMWALAGL